MGSISEKILRVRDFQIQIHKYKIENRIWRKTKDIVCDHYKYQKLVESIFIEGLKLLVYLYGRVRILVIGDDQTHKYKYKKKYRNTNTEIQDRKLVCLYGRVRILGIGDHPARTNPHLSSH